jgi:putative ATP-binding cassette transporter
VFADYYLFDDIDGASDGEQDPEIARYLQTFDLADKVTVRRGTYSTTAVSQGQRKRLALLTMCLERRPILIFDEWAAEQDPTFKRNFYQSILPAIKSQGRTVVVVTHDEAYLDKADRIVALEYGQIAPRGLSAVMRPVVV